VSEPEITTLPGGERIVTDRLRGVRSVALGLWIATGSRDEPRSRAGVSHFIEHLLFKGSSRYTAQGIAELFDTMGGELNAATSRETTVLYTRVPDGHLPEALDAMADMVFAPTFADVDSEREVVLDLTTVRHDATLTVKGTLDLLMTDYGIKPPTAMLGMLKTEPKVTVTFETVLAVPLT